MCSRLSRLGGIFVTRDKQYCNRAPISCFGTFFTLLYVFYIPSYLFDLTFLLLNCINIVIHKMNSWVKLKEWSMRSDDQEFDGYLFSAIQLQLKSYKSWRKGVNSKHLMPIEVLNKMKVIVLSKLLKYQLFDR